MPSLCSKRWLWCARVPCRWLRKRRASPRWQPPLPAPRPVELAAGRRGAQGHFHTMSATERGWAKTGNRASLVQNLRIRVETSRGKFEHGGGDPLIVDGCQVSCTAFQHGGFGAQKIGHVVHPRFVAVLRDEIGRAHV